MIGSRVSLLAPRPYGALLCLASAMALVGLGVGFRLPALIPTSALPLAVGLCLLFSGARRFLARFTPTAIQIAKPPQSIPYSTIREVRPVVPPGVTRPRSFAIEVVHDEGSLLIPSTLSVPSERVYVFLRGFLPGKPERSLTPALATYQREQEQAFGPERVFCYRGRRGPFHHPHPAIGPVCAGFLYTGLFWVVVAILRPSESGWYAAAAAAFFVGFILFLAQKNILSGASSRLRGGTHGLVIGPQGLALEQGPLNGLLTWQEIRGISLRTAAQPFTGARDRTPAIAIDVEGATIAITDSYDQPLGEIYDRVLRYWR